MYVMCHLLSGLLLGILLSLPSGDRRLALACTLGAVLPDMVDKPLGLLISGTVGYGRIYSHSLAMWLVLIGVCVAYWAFSRRTTRSPGLFIALGLGFSSTRPSTRCGCSLRPGSGPFLDLSLQERRSR